MNHFRSFFKNHIEWVFLLSGLLLLGFMNPYISNGFSWCLFDLAGISFCPGDGLGHSIAYLFRGDLKNALQANIFGPFAIIIIMGRVVQLWNKNFQSQNGEIDG